MNNIIQTIKESPIRNCLYNNKDIPFANIISKEILDIDSKINLMLENSKEKFKVVVVGEVKSGKSMFINSFLKEYISEVDILESTSKIIEISYSTENYIKDDDYITKIYIENEVLKNITIVDTPGIKSITKANEELTKDYIKKADIILFVIDITHLGQEDIISDLKSMTSYNKDVIGIINKADLLEEDINVVLEYINLEYSVYFKDFFVISSKLEYNDSYINDDFLNKNYINIYNYIEYLSDNVSKISKDNYNKQIESILDKEKNMTTRYIKNLRKLIDRIDVYEELLFNKNKDIQNEIDREIELWINNYFLSDEIDRIKVNLESAKIYIDETYINEVINKKKLDLDKLFFNLWIESLEDVDSKINIEMEEIFQVINKYNTSIADPKINIGMDKFNIQEIMATIGTGAVVGITSASIVSAYASTIGSSAATTTITSAMSIYCPPIVIASTVTCGIGKVVYDAIKNQQRNSDILGDIEKIKFDISRDVSIKLKKSYEECSKEILSISKNLYLKSNKVDDSIYQIETFIKEISEYIKNLENY